MTIVVLLVVVAVVGAVVIVLAGRTGQQAEFEPDRPMFVLPDEPLAPADIDAVRFAVGLRGYRMDQVDAVMDRLATELADRDRQLAELRGESAPVADGERFVDDPQSAEVAAASNAADVDAAAGDLVEFRDAPAENAERE